MRTHHTRELYIPKDASLCQALDSEAVAYLYERNGKPHAMGFGGQRQKYDWHFSFRSEEEREKYIANYFTEQAAHNAAVQQRAIERNATVTELVAGDILVWSWGYEQTNVEFFEVLSVSDSGKSVNIQPIGYHLAYSEGLSPMSGMATPNRERRNGGIETKRANKDYVRMVHGIARKWDGHPAYVSWYG